MKKFLLLKKLLFIVFLAPICTIRATEWNPKKLLEIKDDKAFLNAWLDEVEKMRQIKRKINLSRVNYLDTASNPITKASSFLENHPKFFEKFRKNLSESKQKEPEKKIVEVMKKMELNLINLPVFDTKKLEAFSDHLRTVLSIHLFNKIADENQKLKFRFKRPVIENISVIEKIINRLLSIADSIVSEKILKLLRKEFEDTNDIEKYFNAVILFMTKNFDHNKFLEKYEEKIAYKKIESDGYEIVWVGQEINYPGNLFTQIQNRISFKKERFTKEVGKNVEELAASLKNITTFEEEVPEKIPEEE